MARLINNADQSPFDEWAAGIALNAQADANEDRNEAVILNHLLVSICEEVRGGSQKLLTPEMPGSAPASAIHRCIRSTATNPNPL